MTKQKFQQPEWLTTVINMLRNILEGKFEDVTNICLGFLLYSTFSLDRGVEEKKGTSRSPTLWSRHPGGDPSLFPICRFQEFVLFRQAD